MNHPMIPLSALTAEQLLDRATELRGMAPTARKREVSDALIRLAERSERAARQRGISVTESKKQT